MGNCLKCGHLVNLPAQYDTPLIPIISMVQVTVRLYKFSIIYFQWLHNIVYLFFLWKNDPLDMKNVDGTLSSVASKTILARYNDSPYFPVPTTKIIDWKIIRILRTGIFKFNQKLKCSRTMPRLADLACICFFIFYLISILSLTEY